MNEELAVFSIALSYIKEIKTDIVKKFAETGISLSDFFEGNFLDISRMLGITGNFNVSKKMLDNALAKASDDYKNLIRHKVKPISILDPSYPYRLREIPDAPIVIYVLGDENVLSSEHIASLVGTRKPTPYGIDFCGKLIGELASYFPDLVVVSGLAYGIDATAHKAAISSSRPTAAVLAHGLDMIYPATHRELARKILNTGGTLLSEYPFGEKPYRQRFLERNRIVAAVSDVTVVVESAIKGGAMSTAHTAFSYSREVMALPGKISDPLSEGCNLLIRKEKARLITCGADLIEATGWQPENFKIDCRQRNLFPELEGEGKIIYDTLRFNAEPMQLDTIFHICQIPMPKLLAVLGEMEFDGIITKYPGNRYALS